MKSESIKELATALSKAQSQFDHAKKDVKNEFFKSKYADLASVIDAAKEHLGKNGLSVSQLTNVDENGNILLETILMHSSGEWISGVYPIKPIKTDPQAYGSAMTYARRYAFSAITGIAADDDDGNAASQQSNKQTYQQPVKFWPQNKFDSHKEAWKTSVLAGDLTTDKLKKTLEEKGKLTIPQLNEIDSWGDILEEIKNG